MNTKPQLAALETKLHRNQFILLCLCMLLLLAGTVVASDQFPALMRQGMAARNVGGGIVLEVTDKGEINVGFSLAIKNANGDPLFEMTDKGATKTQINSTP